MPTTIAYPTLDRINLGSIGTDDTGPDDFECASDGTDGPEIHFGTRRHVVGVGQATNMEHRAPGGEIGEGARETR